MIQIAKDNFDLSQICQSGQCFRMTKEKDNTYSVIAGGRYLEVEQQGNICTFHCDESEFENFWKDYFDLDGNYEMYMAKVAAADFYLKDAVAFGSGIRILRQDLWEMIVSFLISQQNNIARIRRCIDLLCRKYGEQCRTAEGMIYYAFPLPKALAEAKEEDLYACNLGYRSRYVKETAASICRGEVDLEAVMKMKDEEAAKELQKLCGVGIKVANCVRLFALHHTDAFPVDTHIDKVLKSQYPEGFPFERYRGYSGSLQQYIFYYDLRKTGRKIKD